MNTGGVIYVRQVIHALSDCFYNVKVFSVNSEYQEYSIKRTLVRDITSRLIFHPSVSVFSVFKVLRCLSDVNEVYFHSGKHWFLLLLINLFYKNIKVTCISDNIEFDLFSINERSSFARRAVNLVEKGIRFVSESLSYRLSDKVTFITNDDFGRACEIYRLNRERNILPISVPLRNNLFSKKLLKQDCLRALLPLNRIMKLYLSYLNSI
ncbi:hypothetical protein QWY96_05270 [Vibrio artabrorum]|uniref:Glycosyltransferase subfamily 4-like N-terminal domain-containing protein n=1 Tax=Vibrio artabrorum TaxID=446374 RepID=A0ABT8CGI0_9VIBR|nr:hypothetical protein [Vibrio artabrorum]MDN3700440.1 hypothetical protein [Vibrio artabrorum]